MSISAGTESLDLSVLIAVDLTLAPLFYFTVHKSHNHAHQTTLQVGLERDESDADTTYRSLLAKLPEGPVFLEDAYAAIEAKVATMEQYVEVWLQYQSLWDMDIGMVYNRLGENMEKWMVLLKDIK